MGKRILLPIAFGPDGQLANGRLEAHQWQMRSL
jgi:hypothetical protein